MHHDFQRLMREATALTRSGNLSAATAAIQQALGQTIPQGDATLRPAASQAADGPGAHACIVLDGLTRIVEDADVVERAPKEQAANPASASATQAKAAPLAPQGGDLWLDGSYTHQGRSLDYKLFVPGSSAAATPATPRPLIVMLHGCTQGAADFAIGTQMNALAREQGALVLYPEQSARANPQKCWNWFKPQHQARGRGEPAVIAALTQSIIDTYHVDAARVYVAGLSAGGAMAAILGHEYPELYAAVGVHSGLPHGAATDVMSALSVMRSGGAANGAGATAYAAPTIVFHGDADPTVHVSNGQAVVSAACQGAANGTPLSTATSQGRSEQGQGFTRTVYANAAGQGVAEYWQLHGAGHAWSGGGALGTYTNPKGVDASAEMLRFFMAHQAPSSTP